MSYADILAWTVAVFAGTLAWWVACWGRRGPGAWSFVAGMLVFAVGNLLYGLTLISVSPVEMARWQTLRQMVESFLPGIWLLFSLSYSRGNYREYLHRWRYPLIAAFVLPVGLALGFRDHLIVAAAEVPHGGPWTFGLGFSGKALNLLLLLASVLVLMNLERTYRASLGTMRWRIKFMVLGLGVIFIVQAYVGSQILLFHDTVNLSLQAVVSLAMLLGCPLILRALSRRGHFDADIYPAPSGSSASLTVFVAGIYFLVVGIFAKVVEFLGGDTAFMLRALVFLVGLVLAAILLMSDRARMLARRFASRHFQKPLYDYRSLWRRFTEETSSCVRQAELCQATVKLTADVFQALSVTIWVVDDKHENILFAASTVLSETRANDLRPESSAAIQMMRALETHPEPVDLDASKEPWADALKRCHPDEFRKGGSRVCVPLIGGGRMLGVLIVGDRVGGTPFSWQDFDLLKCVADSVAACLLNLQLSQKLLQAGQLEAFQTLSAFFVHDLKNTASTLSLMLKNLPVHFDDPQFRQDTLRGIAKTVTHVNRLIERVGQLRGSLQVKTVVADLNDLVLKTLAGMEAATDISLVKNLHPLPKILLDQEQMIKVLTNLLFNAREAISATGQIHIETSQNNGWAVLAVSDNGCGMSPEFLNSSLFRPFQTTKKNGLGIGLFQSKMIVEAHQGRIQVESLPDHGTTFRIILPVPKPIL